MTRCDLDGSGCISTDVPFVGSAYMRPAVDGWAGRLMFLTTYGPGVVTCALDASGCTNGMFPYVSSSTSLLEVDLTRHEILFADPGQPPAVSSGIALKRCTENGTTCAGIAAQGGVSKSHKVSVALDEVSGDVWIVNTTSVGHCNHTGTTCEWVDIAPQCPGCMDLNGVIDQPGRMLYMIPLIAVTEIVAGVLLLTGRFVPLALALLAPVIVNIVGFHLFLAPAGLGVPAVVLGLELYLAWTYRDAFAPMLQRRATPRVPVASAKAQLVHA